MRGEVGGSPQTCTHSRSLPCLVNEVLRSRKGVRTMVRCPFQNQRRSSATCPEFPIRSAARLSDPTCWTFLVRHHDSERSLFFGQWLAIPFRDQVNPPLAESRVQFRQSEYSPVPVSRFDQQILGSCPKSVISSARRAAAASRSSDRSPR